MVELFLPTVPACPNAAAFEERLAAALAGAAGGRVGIGDHHAERGRA
jgi:hypothetical protein